MNYPIGFRVYVVPAMCLGTVTGWVSRGGNPVRYRVKIEGESESRLLMPSQIMPYVGRGLGDLEATGYTAFPPDEPGPPPPEAA